MAVRKKTKLLFGSNSKKTYFGKCGGSKGMYTGGFDYHVYGIKGIIALTIYKAWGSFIFDNPNLK